MIEPSEKYLESIKDKDKQLETTVDWLRTLNEINQTLNNLPIPKEGEGPGPNEAAIAEECLEKWDITMRYVNTFINALDYLDNKESET